MDYRILGPLEVLDGERALQLGGRKQRALLAFLLLHANEIVSSERLVDELWGERPPPTAGKIVQNYVSRLRKELAGGRDDGAGQLVTLGPGYVLRLDPEELDHNRFDALAAEARQALRAGLAEEAAGKLRGRARSLARLRARRSGVRAVHAGLDQPPRGGPTPGSRGSDRR
jgi:DNA-binding SARP family transcriptional activator